MFVLRPPSPVFCNMPFATRSFISLRAVSCEHFAIFGDYTINLRKFSEINQSLQKRKSRLLIKTSPDNCYASTLTKSDAGCLHHGQMKSSGKVSPSYS